MEDFEKANEWELKLNIGWLRIVTKRIPAPLRLVTSRAEGKGESRLCREAKGK
jgi:hypothetical protein